LPSDRAVVAVIGATATGKTAVAETLAERTGGEIVCADSRQVFRELEIGTGKPTPAERAARPHHLFEAWTLEREARPSAGWFAAAARDAIAGIHARGRLPIVVGGSGLYLRAAMSGLAAMPPADPAARERLDAEIEREGIAALHHRLERLDPETAARLKPRDRQRIVRALEVLESTGRPLTWWHAQQEGPRVEGQWALFELVIRPEALGRRIESRTRSMFEGGLIEETRKLIGRGLGPSLARLRAVGYDEAAALIEGALTRDAAESLTRRRTVQLAKRQRTWFRHQIVAEPVLAEDDAPEAIATRLASALRPGG
jgi:tRNA dimethylallyltransferase